MNAYAVARGLYVAGMSKHEVSTLIKDILVQSFVNIYNTQGLTSDFKRIGMHSKRKWKRKIEQEGVKVIEEMLCKKLSFDACVIDALNTVDPNEDDVEKLDTFITLLNKHLDIDVYITTTSLNREIAIKLIKYVIRGCFEHPYKSKYTANTITNVAYQYIHPDDIDTILAYTESLIEEHDNIKKKALDHLGRFLGKMITVKDSEGVLAKILSLPYLNSIVPFYIPPIMDETELFEFTEGLLDVILESSLTLDKLIKEIATCLYKGINLDKQFKDLLNEYVAQLLSKDILLEQIAMLDDETLKQFREVLMLVY